jgi:hypothetical protein
MLRARDVLQSQGGMNQNSTAAQSRFHAQLRTLACVICKRFQSTGQRVEIHHIAKGSSRQNDWLVVPLCTEHHRGGAGLHGMGVKGFCSLYRVPHEIEYGLLAWVTQDLQEKLGLKKFA